MKVYVISVLNTKQRVNEESNEKTNEVIASVPLAVFSDKTKAIRTMQEFMEHEEKAFVSPMYNMFRHGDKVTCSLTENSEDACGNRWTTEVTLRTIDMDDEGFNIDDEVTASWN